ncbi:NAD(P)-dependent alcohol dehydrogenase [Kineosporia babensis]|uniref:NAD(P)-dependent alcohol dehydrogenase n=1 Tax=Kineosporia babensis TaxID=499548 RepID=A0A9X1NKG3_9ACTN|nr:NAD(P)-dependent alcohol dehydrogenase [Kineosporia babensis]MCD5315915.1 NAD(P)-dependent alcohol dehydrogenase [Kineosporia babensis]
MRAVRYAQYGGPEVLSVEQVPIPLPGPTQVRIRVAATSVNAADVHVRSGSMRLLTGRKFPKGTGIDAVGEVEATGADVSSVSVGQRVWAVTGDGRAFGARLGSAAESALFEQAHVTAAPADVTDLGAAATVMPATMAVRTLREAARLLAGERVLVRGATGAVGSAVVQLANALGAHVIALTNAANTDLAQSLGASEVFDYATTRPADIRLVDVIVDTVGTGLMNWRRRLAPGGRMVTLAATPGALASVAAGRVISLAGGPRMSTFIAQPPNHCIAEAARHVEEKFIRPVIDSVYPFEQATAAHRAFESGGLRGRVLLTP